MSRGWRAWLPPRYTRARTHARTHARAHARAPARAHAQTHARTHACTPARTHRKAVSHMHSDCTLAAQRPWGVQVCCGLAHTVAITQYDRGVYSWGWDEYVWRSPHTCTHRCAHEGTYHSNGNKDKAYRTYRAGGAHTRRLTHKRTALPRTAPFQQCAAERARVWVGPVGRLRYVPHGAV